MQLIIDMGSERPKYPINLTVYPDGKALVSSGAEVHETGVKMLGEHGELVDRDYIKANGLSLNDAPTVMEAST